MFKKTALSFGQCAQSCLRRSCVKPNFAVRSHHLANIQENFAANIKNKGIYQEQNPRHAHPNQLPKKLGDASIGVIHESADIANPMQRRFLHDLEIQQAQRSGENRWLEEEKISQDDLESLTKQITMVDKDKCKEMELKEKCKKLAEKDKCKKKGDGKKGDGKKGDGKKGAGKKGDGKKGAGKKGAGKKGDGKKGAAKKGAAKKGDGKKKDADMKKKCKEMEEKEKCKKLAEKEKQEQQKKKCKEMAEKEKCKKMADKKKGGKKGGDKDKCKKK